VWGIGWIPAAAVYDNFGSILTVCSLSSLVFSALLYLRGPSGPDGARTGNQVFDYYWGVELHPRVFGMDLKQLANCRLGMMSWCAIIWSFAARQYVVYHYISSAMWVVVVLQTAYVMKFFFWERGYLSTLDMMHDHFGFYICWGVTTWLPAVYTSQALYLVNHPCNLGAGWTCALLAFGLGSIYLNYAADAQRKRVRETQGKTLIWGKEPELIVAGYRTADGRDHENLLLVSGWWGVSRHFHYLPEMATALAWTLPCGFQNFLPWSYFVFLAILLTHRAIRDDERCAAKYGAFWDEYRARVPFRIVPGIF
jgi:7-dehydrocholesterol reductase